MVDATRTTSVPKSCRWISLGAVILAFLPMGANAQGVFGDGPRHGWRDRSATYAPGVDRRLDQQYDRLERSERRGTLSRRETRRLLAELDAIEITRDRMARDGRLSWRERRRLHAMLDATEQDVLSTRRFRRRAAREYDANDRDFDRTGRATRSAPRDTPDPAWLWADRDRRQRRDAAAVDRDDLDDRESTTQTRRRTARLDRRPLEIDEQPWPRHTPPPPAPARRSVDGTDRIRVRPNSVDDRHRVTFPRQYRSGEIIVSFSDRRLYFVTGSGEALSYPIGVPKSDARWDGVLKVSAKRENPRWTPTASMRKENPKLPEFVPGGDPANPLGVRALYLGNTLYRIHGTSNPASIGRNVSKGCIRMHNQHVVELFDAVEVGAKVTATYRRFSVRPLADADRDDGQPRGRSQTRFGRRG